MTAAARSDRTFHIVVMCSGNICRSPIGEKVLQAAFAEAGLADRVRVSSGGTGGWHVGQGANDQAVRVLAEVGLPTDHVARQLGPDDFDDADLILAADRGHLRDLRRMLDDQDRIALFRSFDPQADSRDSDEIPDPYYGPYSGFQEVLAMTRAAAPGVVAAVREQLAP